MRNSFPVATRTAVGAGNSHSAGREIKLEHATEGLPIPLHPGAERFYREKGLIK